MKADYVIVGGGSAGCVLAARLSEDPTVKVALLEAGGAGKSWLVKAPMGVVAMVRGAPKINNWAFETEMQPGLNNRRGFQPRGKALGGSSAINAMLYIRGHQTDYDDWVAAGAKGWGFDDVLPYFKKSENNSRGANALHGVAGPLSVSDQQSPREISSAFVEAGEQLQFARNADFNGERQEGMGLYQVTQFSSGDRNGQRCSAAAAYLHPILSSRKNLEVITHAQATEIDFEGKRAVGVSYRRKNGPLQTIKAAKEVILCGGSFNSPQLLMLSGIGDPNELQAHGIDVRHALPGVGKNLQDHLDVVLAYQSQNPELLGLGVLPSLRMGGELLKWVRTGKGLLASPAAEGGAFLKTTPDLARPNVQLHFVVAVVDDHARKLHWGYGYSCHVCQLRPYSRGRVGLHSSDPMQPPLIDPAYLSDERDLDEMVDGAILTRRIMEADALAPYRGKDIFTSDVQTREDWADYIRGHADTIYHPVGTCRMGTDPMSVTDPQLNVHGVDALRVVDASIMPTLVGGNTNAPTIMIAEKAADLIKAAA